MAWEEVPSLYGRGPAERVFTVRHTEDAEAVIQVGDGKAGARLPTGRENVRATYRSGTGLAGEVGAGALTLLKTRPYGIRAVTNPLPAGGAEDPEALEDARTNAPVTVLTLDRIVSLRDYEDFARAFDDADVLVLTEVYPAGEAPIAGADAKALARAIRARGRIDPVVVNSAQELREVLPDVLLDGDLLLMMGAGDIGHAVQKLADEGFPEEPA